MTYYSKVLYPFVEKLVRENKTTSSIGYTLNVCDLDECDQYLFAMHLIENDDRYLTCITENNNYDSIIQTLFKLLKKDSTDEKLDFAEKIREEIICYYKQTMQKMIDDIIGWVEQEDFIGMGYINRHHVDNGERYWSRP